MLAKCKRTRDKDSGTIIVISRKSFTYLPRLSPLLRTNYHRISRKFKRNFPSRLFIFFSTEKNQLQNNAQFPSSPKITFLIFLLKLGQLDVPACPRKPVRQKQRARSTGRRRCTCSRVRITPPRRGAPLFPTRRAPFPRSARMCSQRRSWRTTTARARSSGGEGGEGRFRGPTRDRQATVECWRSV